MNYKKIRIIVILLILCFCFSGCEKEDTDKYIHLIEKDMEDKVKRGDIAFSTEYDIEDYSKGCFIVSKSDRLLYGLLDDEGNEILPIKYDSIEFLNINRIEEKNQEEGYLITEYEGTKKIVNSKGKIVINNDVKFIEYKLPVEYDDNTPCYIYRNGNHMILYKENGEIALEYNYDEHDVTFINFISDKYFVVSQTDINWVSQNKMETDAIGVTLYDMKGKKIIEWNDCDMFNRLFVNGDKVFFYVTSKNVYYKKIVDEYGNVEEDENEYGIKDIENAIKVDMDFDYTGQIDINNNTYILGNRLLYKTNKSWKLVNEDGENVYDERYYDCEKINDCYLLQNEDEQICLINRKGIKLIDYGILIKNEYGMCCFKDVGLSENNILTGDEEVYILI